MFNTRLIGLMSRAMDASTLRNSVINNNIANENTPGFKKSEVSFKATLENSLDSKLQIKRTKINHIHGIEEKDKYTHVYQVKDTKIKTDGNNVDIDMENSKLAENSLYFNSLTNFMSNQLGLLRNSIRGE